MHPYPADTARILGRALCDRRPRGLFSILSIYGTNPKFIRIQSLNPFFPCSKMLGNHPYSRLALAMSRALLWTVVLANFVLILTLEKERLVPYDYEPNTYHYVNSAEPNSPELFRLFELAFS